MKTSMTEEIRKKAEETGVRISGRVRLWNMSDTLRRCGAVRVQMCVWTKA